VLSLVESRLHGFLKKVGMAFLVNQGCFLVDSEVPLTMFGQRRLSDLDGRRVIDVCGVGEGFFKPDDGRPEGLWLGEYELKRNILRGVEVKVSRSDLRNGFVCSGCNYNYLLTPMKLTSPSAMPRGVGLIEYNRYKFSVELDEDGRFCFEGLRVVRNPSFRRIRHYVVDNATAHIAQRRLTGELDALLDEMVEGHSELGYKRAREVPESSGKLCQLHARGSGREDVSAEEVLYRGLRLAPGEAPAGHLLH